MPIAFLRAEPRPDIGHPSAIAQAILRITQEPIVVELEI